MKVGNRAVGAFLTVTAGENILSRGNRQDRQEHGRPGYK